MRHCERSVAIFAVSLYLLVTSSFPSQAYEIDRSASVSITAGIEDNRVFIYGFTSPNSRVELSNAKVYDITFSKDNGYFEFDRIILPKDPGELCLLAIDDSFRHTNPVCIPPPPPTNYLTNIGPIILPPTLTIESDKVEANSTTAASGQSIPFSDISVYLYQTNNSAPIIPKPAQAFGLPVFTTRSDAQGNYNLNIPTSLSSDYRLFSTVEFATQASPKSNTIVYSLPSLWWLFWLQNRTLIIMISFFSISLIAFSYILYLYFHKPVGLRYLPAIFEYPLSLYPIFNPRRYVIK